MVSVGKLRILSDIADRASLATTAGLTFGGSRDLYSALGYKRDLRPADYRDRYRRNGLAATVVEAAPKATWRGGVALVEDEDPDVLTSFEEAWTALEARLNIWAVLARLDVLAGLGRYAVLLVGLPGDLSAERPASVSLDEVAYLTPIGEEDATIQKVEEDSASPNFGLPLAYSVRRLGGKRASKMVHASRVIHVADGLLDDRVYGQPRLERVWNWLDDLEKVTGGGAEAFWKRADRGIHVKFDPEKEVDPAEVEKIKASVEEYIHGFRRTIGTVGAELDMLGSDVANFNNQVDALLTLIAGSTGVPKRILVGSERGELASTQDRTNWDERVSDRRVQFAEPEVVRPLVDMLVGMGALPEPEHYDVAWPEIESLDEAQKAEVASKWAALNAAAGETVVTGAEIRDHVLGLAPLAEAAGPEQTAPLALARGRLMIAKLRLARRRRAAPLEAALRGIRKQADAHVGAVAKVVAQASRAARAALPLEELERALAVRDTREVERLVAQALTASGEVYREKLPELGAELVRSAGSALARRGVEVVR